MLDAVYIDKEHLCIDVCSCFLRAISLNMNPDECKGMFWSNLECDSDSEIHLSPPRGARMCDSIFIRGEKLPRKTFMTTRKKCNP